MNGFDPLDFSGGAAKRDENGAPIDPLDAAAAEVAAEAAGAQNSAARASLYSVLDTPADTAARHQRLARKTGVPADVVSRNESDVTRTAYLNDIDRAIADSPTLAARLASPEFAALAHDDLENLSMLERFTRQVTGGVTELGGLVTSGVGQLLDISQRAMALRGEAIGGRTPWEDLVDPDGAEPRRSLREAPVYDDSLRVGLPLQAIGADINTFARDTVMIPEAQRAFMDHVFAGLGQVAGQIVTAPLTGGWSLYAQGAGVMGEKIAKDTPTPFNDLAVVLGAGVTGATEAWALDKLLGPMAVPIKNEIGAALARIGIASLSEGVQEATENTLHDVVRKVLVNPDAPIDLGQSFDEGTVGATVGGIVRSIVEAGLHVRVRSARSEQAARQADEAAGVLEQINQLAAADKVLARDADTLEAFIEDSIDEGAPTDELYVDGRLLMQSETGELSDLGAALAEASPAVAEQLREAASRGGAVRIPFAEYTARIAGTDLAGELLDHVRLGEHEFSRAEAREFMQSAPERIEAQLQEQIAKAQDGQAARESTDAVREAISAQLVGTGRHSKAVTDAYTALWASFYEATGARLGYSADELYAQYPLKVRAQGAPGAATLAQGDPVLQSLKADAVARQAEADALFDAAEPDGDAILASGGKVHEAQEKLAAQLETLDDASFALEAKTPGGRLLTLTPSAQEPGKYQLTTFDSNGAPWGDTQYASKGEAIRELLNDADVSTLADYTRALGQDAAPALPETIDIDGVARPTTNADGRAIHPTAEGVRNFWRWYAPTHETPVNPEVAGTASDTRSGTDPDAGRLDALAAAPGPVDAQGRPRVFAHGTSDDVSEFDLEHPNRKDAGWLGRGVYGTNDAYIAETYARVKRGDAAPNVMPLYFAVRNPYRATLEDKQRLGAMSQADVDAFTDALKALGHDGVTLEFDDGTTEIVAFDTKAVKSAIGNRGTFDDSDKILNQSATPADLVITHNLSGNNLLHADKMGGLPVPSLAVTKADQPLTGFGEITLLGSKEMADPRGYAKTKVFGADIYSPRYPSVEFFVSPAARKRAEKDLAPAEAATGSGVDWGEVQRNGARYLRDAPAIKWLFLRSQGITSESVYVDAPTLAPELAPFLEDLRFVHELEKDSAFIDAAFALFQKQLESRYAAEMDTAQRVASALASYRAHPDRVRRIVRDAADALDDYRQQARQAGRVDARATRWKIDDAISTAGLEDALERFAEDYLSELDPTEKIFQGFTSAGNRRYSAHTLDNVVKILKKELRSGEGFNYGAGSLRAHFTPQFKSIKEIRDSKERLLDEKAFEAVAQEVDGELVALFESFNEGGAQVSLDRVTEILADVSKMGLERSAAEAGITLSEDTKQRAIEFLTRLRNLPTEYFEAKILRDVDLAEFSGAVVPDNASAEVLAVLAKRGVKDVRTYKAGDETDRAKKIAEFNHLLFQRVEQRGRHTAPRGTFDIDSRTITLLAGADLSTFLHESGHFFLEIQTDLASRLRAEAKAFGADSLTEQQRQYLTDTDAVLEWFGVRDLDTWNALSFDEKVSYHEQFARGFEAYLFEGKAPSLELAGIFARFRSWLVRIYKKLQNLNVELSPEVRQVFDRMLATDEAIETAQQARSMVPLFESETGAGGAVEDFARYQALGDDATEDAKATLASRGLRDMQWLGNARSRELKRLQKQAELLRAARMMEVRAQVMSQPVYRAWQFLTAKLGADDKIGAARARKSDPDTIDETVDDLFAAIAKLGGINKDQAVGTWGIDPADRPRASVFGKHVWRRGDAGLSLDGMAEALSQYGYLDLDEQGKPDLAQFEHAFKAQLSGEPVYSSAIDYASAQQVRPGDQVHNLEALTAGRLDLAALDAMDVDPDRLARLKAYRMTAKNGLHPDIVAALILDENGEPAFDSGDALLHALAAADPPQVEIEALTDVAMLEEHGELSSPDALERAADAAIHNVARARFVTTQANAVANATGQPRLLMRAVREYAAKAIARQRVRDIKPHQYTQAEARAGKAAKAAEQAGDLPQAAAEARNQALNNALAREALRARDEVERMRKYLAKFDNKEGRRNIPAEYMDQIEALRAPFDLKKGTTLKEADRRASLAQWVEAMRERNIEIDLDVDLLEKASLTAYRDLTMEQLRALHEAVKTVEHTGRLKSRLLRAQDAREFALIEAEIANSIRDNGGDPRRVDVEPEDSLLKRFMAQNRKLSSLARQMDGGNDDGPLYQHLVRGMNDAGARVASMNEKATEALVALYALVLALKGGTKGDVRFIPEAGVSLSRGGRLALALNMGNDTNRARVRSSDWGNGRWNDAQIDAILKTLTRTEWEFVQGVWDFLDSYWPEIAAKQRRLTGVAPEKVEARPFARTLADGTTVHLRGGYYPIKYDPTKDDKAASHDAAQEAKDMMRGAFTAATTRRGHTITRLEDVKRPLFLSLGVIDSHVIQVTSDLAWHEWIIDANRILSSRDITSAIRDHYGDEILKTIKATIPAIATGEAQRMTAAQKILMWLRGNVSRSTMGWSLTTALLQPFGLLQSVERIGAKHVLRGLSIWAGDAAQMQNSMTWIAEKSEFMRLRNKTFNRELYEIKGRVQHGRSRARQVYDASIFMLMQKMQLVADVPTWLGAYEKALDAGYDDAEATAQADRAVIESQGAGQVQDLTEFQRNHPMMTMFFSYFSVTYNRMAESTAATDFKNPLAVAGWMVDMALLAVIPALAPALIQGLLRGDEGDDEPEDWIAKLAKWQATYLMGLVPLVREGSGALEGFDYSGPPAGRIVNDLGKMGTQLAQGELDEGLAIATVRTVGTLLGLPTTQLVRSYKGWKAWEDDDAPGTAILMGPPRK